MNPDIRKKLMSTVSFKTQKYQGLQKGAILSKQKVGLKFPTLVTKNVGNAKNELDTKTLKILTLPK